jgi:D-3-phosphoglycerate dehydrogenase
MKVVVADPIHKAGVEFLRREGMDVVVATDMERQELLKELEEADALLVRSRTKVTQEVLERAGRLRVIGRAGVGVDNIDLEAATRQGVVVVNAPEASTITVAEHTIGLILALARRIPFANASLKAGRWEKKKFLGCELRGKTLGVIGLGRIGTQVALKAKAFDMKILAYDPYISEGYGRDMGIEVAGLEEVLRRADFITLHVPLTDKTRGLIGREEFAKMKDGVYIVNCARGGILVESALIEALDSGKVAGAAIDVFEVEPPLGRPILKAEKVVVTPHLGASTEEAQRYASTIACEEVVKVLRSEPPRNVVNMPAIPPEAMERLRGYLSLAEILGRFTVQLVRGRLKDVSVTFCGALAEVKEQKVLCSAALSGLLSPILTERVNLLNAPIVAKNRRIRVTLGKREDSEEYDNLLLLEVKTDEGETRVKGSLLGEKEPRVVEVDGYSLDLAPEGRILLVRHEDRPGMIGRVALALGNSGINIASMQVGRKEKGGLQLMILLVDQVVPEKVAKEISGLKGVQDVKAVELER